MLFSYYGIVECQNALCHSGFHYLLADHVKKTTREKINILTLLFYY